MLGRLFAAGPAPATARWSAAASAGRAALGPRRQGSSISVILLDAVENWGGAGDVVSVKRGFARNYLVPRRKAVYATLENKQLHASLVEERVFALKQQQTAVAVKSGPSAAEQAALINELVKGRVLLAKEANEKGTLFSSVSPSDIVSAIHVQFGGSLLPVSVIDSLPSIKEVGVFTVKLATGLTEISLEVKSSTGPTKKIK